MSKHSYRWLYNLAEDRFYTYEDLKAQRDVNPFPDQMNTQFPKLDMDKVNHFIKERLHNPATYQIDYSDPQKLLPEVWMTEEMLEKDEDARLYEKAMKMIDQDPDADSVYGEEEAVEDAE